MKFTCSQAALSKSINTVIKAVSTRTTIPILKGILVDIKKGRATLTASDLNISIETSFDVQNSTDGSTVVNAKLFGDIVRKLPNSLINIDCEKEPMKMCINCIGSDFSIVALPAEEFPIIAAKTTSNFIELNKKDFEDVIRKIVFSASIDEKKGILTGCLFNLKEYEIEAVALDGFRMAIAKKETKVGTLKSVIIPADILTEVQKILNEENGDMISVLFEDKKAEFLTEDTRVVARLLEGDFIKYKDILPTTYSTKITVNREDMLSSIERASLFAKEGKNNLVKLSISEDFIDIESKSEEGNVKEHIGTEKEGQDLIIGFNSKYLMDVLKVINDEEVVFEMGSSVSSCLIKPVEGSEYTYLVLPVRISNNN